MLTTLFSATESFWILEEWWGRMDHVEICTSVFVDGFPLVVAGVKACTYCVIDGIHVMLRLLCVSPCLEKMRNSCELFSADYGLKRSCRMVAIIPVNS